MDINWMYVWLLMAVVLILLEFAVGTLVLFSLAISALVICALTALFPALGVLTQLGLYALANLIIVPLVIRFIRPRFSPKATHYGPAGSGAQDGLNYQTQYRDYDEATCIMIDNNLYRTQFEDGRTPELNTQVVLLRFESTVAIVKPTN